MFDKPTIYVSHAIIGTTGDMEGNCKIAIKGINKLRRIFPEVDFYIPAESDRIIQILYKYRKLSIENILWADLKILANCHGWMYYRFQESKGSEVERKKAIELGFVKRTENDIVWDIRKANYMVLRKKFIPIVGQVVERFRNGQTN